ncbi:MAG: V-type ATP synthase subunit D, partial [Candidatus Njordarchaeales archaeon]
LIRQFAYHMSEILQDLIKLGEIEIWIEVIANDLERTNRTVNALEKIIIPQLKALAKYIQDLIEEEDLEEFTRIKLVRNIIIRRREG